MRAMLRHHRPIGAGQLKNQLGFLLSAVDDGLLGRRRDVGGSGSGRAEPEGTGDSDCRSERDFP